MESNDFDRANTDVGDDLGDPGSSVETAGSERASVGAGLFGIGGVGGSGGPATDVDHDLGDPRETGPGI
jgi:hypothetical protein